jgi:hypothetical protein
MAWLDSNWPYRQKITVDNTKVAADLTDFPIYLDLSDFDTDFWTNVQSGGELRITKSDETTEVPREIVSFTDNGTTGEGEVHFLADGTLSSSSDTDYYIYYGNSGASDYAVDGTYGAENAWNSDYEMVHHLTGASVTDLDDSTANDHDMTHDGGSPAYDTTAQVGEGVDFDGVDDYSKRLEGDFLTSQTSGTLSFWIKTTVAHGAYFFAVSDEDSAARFFACLTLDTGQASLYVHNNSGGSNIMKSTSSIDSGNWHHVVMQSNGSTTSMWIDGVSDTVIARNGTNDGRWFGWPAQTDNISIGAFIRSDGIFEGDVTMDEVRVSTAQLSSDWITTEHNNQNSPSTFYSMSAEEEDATTFVPKVMII